MVNHALLVLRLCEPAGSQLSPSILGACFWPLNALREIHKTPIDIITNLWSPVTASPPHCPQYLNVFRPHQLEQIWPKFTMISRPTFPAHRPYSQKIILLPLRGKIGSLRVNFKSHYTAKNASLYSTPGVLEEEASFFLFKKNPFSVPWILFPYLGTPSPTL